MTALNGFPDSKQNPEWVGATIHFELMGQGYQETGTVTSTSPGSVTFDYISQAGGPGDLAAGDPFYLTGKLAALDAAGEWFRDPTTNTLYLWTPTGDSPGNHLVEAKARTYGFDLSGLSYITIRGIHFFACSINTSSTSTHDTLDGIQALYVSHFEQASGAKTLWTPHMEDTGIIIRGSNNVLENSEIGFSAGNGVLLQGNNTSLSAGNVVTNNVIHDVDYMCLDEAGINTGNPLGGPGGPGRDVYGATSTYNTISYNTIYNSGRSLILIRNFGSGLIVHNDLYNAMLQSLDGGAIYTYNQNGKAFNNSHPATRIAYNRIHNTHTSYDNATSASTSTTIRPITWWITTWSTTCGSRCISIAGSRNNTVCNNTLYATAFGTACFQACGDGTGTVLANNIYGNRTYITGNQVHLLAQPRGKTSIRCSSIRPRLNFQLQSGSPAKDAGMAIHPYTDGFVGSAPDIGAFRIRGDALDRRGQRRDEPLRPRRSRRAHAPDGHGRRSRRHSRLAGQRRQRNQLLARGRAPTTSASRPSRACRQGPLPIPTRPSSTATTASAPSTGNTDRGIPTSPAAARRAPRRPSQPGRTAPQATPPGRIGGIFGCDSHNWVKYSNVYFDSSLNKVNVTYSTDAGNKYAGIHVEFRLDKPTGPIIGCVVTQSTGGWNKFVTGSGTVSGVTSGVHDLYITCSPLNAPWPAVAIHSFKFSDTAGLAAPTGLVAAGASGGVVNLSWTAHSNNQAGFKIERSTDAQTFMEIGAAGANGRNYRTPRGRRMRTTTIACGRTTKAPAIRPTPTSLSSCASLAVRFPACIFSQTGFNYSN